MNLLKKKVVSVVTLCFFIMTVQLPAKTLTLDDFDGEILKNNVGLPTGTWTDNDAKIDVAYIPVREDSSTLSGDTALKITYRFDGEDQISGWWCYLGDKDYSIYDRVTLWVKREGNEKPFLGVKDNTGFETFIPLDPILTTTPGVWQKVEVSLEKYTDIKNWTSLNNVSVGFFSEEEGPREGTVYIDDVLFEGKPGAEPKMAPPPLHYDMPALDTLSDDELLDLVEHAAFDFFIAESNEENGLVKDHGSSFYENNFKIASVAATGFGLTVWCIGAQRGWISREDAYKRVLNNLKFFKDSVPEIKGFYYHFLNMKTGKREYNSELSSIDTALYIAGALFAGEYFKGTEVENLAKELYDRINWEWMLNGEDTLSMGWKPESGFLPHRWGMYCEHMMLYLLAMGSSTHPIPTESWDAWDRNEDSYENLSFFHCAPLFTHQYSHIWFDFRRIKDKHGDYFDNSIKASLANRQWCIDEEKASMSYGPDSWGLTACDAPQDYRAYGAPYGPEDGTVAPTGAIGSVVFVPEFSLQAMKHFYKEYGKKVWGRFGFTDSFNADKMWFSPLTLAIDQGTIVLMIENYRTGLVWEVFMKIPAIQKAMKEAGFEQYQVDYKKQIQEHLEKVTPKKKDKAA